MDPRQKKANADLERTLEVLNAQISAARKELAEGGKIGKEGQEFHASLQQLAVNKAWAVLCW
jgi:hypothetical protein